MKRNISILLACVLALSMTACGGKKAPATPPATTESSSGPAPSSPAPTAPKEAPATASPEEVAVIDEYNAMIDRYNVVADKINADENLLAIEEVVTATNAVADALNEVSTAIDTADTLSAEDIADLKAVIADANAFIDEMEAMIGNYSGKEVVTIQATLINNTDADLYGLAMSPANDQSWGGNLLDQPLSIGSQGVCTMSITADTLVWDIMAGDSEGTTIEFIGLDFSEVDVAAGATITLSVTEGGAYMATVQ